MSDQLKSYFNNLVATATWDWLKALWGPAVLAGLLAILQKIRHGALDWLAIGGMFLLAAFLLVLDRRNKRPSDSKRPQQEDVWRDPKWEVVDDHTFENSTVELDGKQFWRCRFKNVTLMFRGNAPIEFCPGNEFTQPLSITTDHKPAMMFANLMQMFREMGTGKKITEGALDSHGKMYPKNFSVSVATESLGVALKELIDSDSANITARIRQYNQHMEFHYDSASDPYLDIITELWNGSVFELVNFGEIAGHVTYAGSQLPGDPRIVVSVEPPLINLRHGETAALVVRQFLSPQTADTIEANRNRSVIIDFCSVFVPFKILPRYGPSKNESYRWQGPRFTIEDTVRI